MNNDTLPNEQIREFGLQQLASIDTKTVDVGKWKTWLTDYQFNPEYPDDEYVWLTCILALEAVDSGNPGVGCILVDNGDNVVVHDHAKTFNPYFRSDQHAEMVVMNKFEDTYRNVTKLAGYTLYTSLECCPMCLVRLITSGVNTVLYAASGTPPGMVHRMKDLPPRWVELAKRQVFGQTKCSQGLINAANQIFLINISELTEKLKTRSVTSS